MQTAQIAAAAAADRSFARPESESVPWQERPLLTLQMASDITGVSVASLYKIEQAKRLVFKRLAGRTLVETSSLVALVEGAEDWTPSTRPEKARVARTERARAAWQG